MKGIDLLIYSGLYEMNLFCELDIVSSFEFII